MVLARPRRVRSVGPGLGVARRTLVALAASLAALACFDPDIGARPYRCGPGALCPPGYACGDAGLCLRMPDDPAPSDGRMADGPITDGPPGDGSPGDAAVGLDGPVGDAGPAAECLPACGPESCGPRTCGRSDCGFLCGACTPTLVGAPCLDHYGQMLDEGASGLATCTGQPEQVQRCICTGGGSSAWVSCAAVCREAGCSREGQIGCGYDSCGPGEACCREGRLSSCTTGACGGATARCDGPEDCPGGLCCGDPSHADSATCVSGTSCAPFRTYCHSTADCPASARLCCATAATSGIKACFATPQPGGCN
jgi:hypothetical protein